jgi:hypothetical protein
MVIVVVRGKETNFNKLKRKWPEFQLSLREKERERKREEEEKSKGESGRRSTEE